MQVRPLEAVLALFIFAATALSLREAGVLGIHRDRTEMEAAALRTLVSARVSERRTPAVQRTRAESDHDLPIERAFLTLGNRYLRDGRVPEAIAVFEMTIQAAPRSWAAWNGLGEAYESAGDWPRAAASYVQAVALNPANEGARRGLKRVEGG